MRSVGQVLLAVVLVAGIAAAGVQAVGAIQSAPVDGAPAWLSSVSADESPTDADSVGATVSEAALESGVISSLEGDGQSSAGTAEERGADIDPETVGPSLQQESGQIDAGNDDQIVLTQEFQRLPDEPGSVQVRHNFTFPDRVVTLRTTVPRRGNVTAADGFRRANETIYEWDERTDSPSITYTLGVNETGSREQLTANGSLLFADTGEWALFRRPATSSSWEYRGSEELGSERRSRTMGPGAAGDWLVYLGDVELHPRTTDNQTFRLAVPAAANMSERPERVLDAMERASVDLDVGAQNDAVFAVAAPTEDVPWAVRGLTASQADFWVGDDERLDAPENIWIHEYVHTRQDYEFDTETRWTREGFATYYAAVQALKYQPVTFEEFAETLSTDANATANVTLSNPETWDDLSAYDRGALVAGQLDRRVREASDGERSLDTILAGMNADRDRVNESEFFGAVDRAANGSIDRAIRTAITTDRPVSMWNRSQHVAAFGGMPAQFEYGLPASDDANAYRVGGPYRNETIAAASSPTVVTGESLVVDAVVDNGGSSVGYFDVGLHVDGRVVDAATGTMAPNESQRVPLSYEFDRPGEYTIDIGGDVRNITVVRPAQASIVGVEVTPTDLRQYETARVGVTVRNDARIPAERTVRLQRGTADVFNRSVRVGPNATRTTEIELEFPLSGTTTVMAAGGQSVEVDVEPTETPSENVTEGDSPTNSPAETAVTAEGTGFRSIGSLLAIVAAVVAVRWTRSGP